METEEKDQPWVTNEVVDLCDQRRQLKLKKYTNTEAGLEYRKVNIEARKKMKEAKEECIEEQCQNTEGNNIKKQQRGLEHPQGFSQRLKNASQQSSKSAMKIL